MRRGCLATVVMDDRCALRPRTLYYGWLLPMSIIILHNLVVFALVLRVLYRKQPGGIVYKPVRKVPRRVNNVISQFTFHRL